MSGTRGRKPLGDGAALAVEVRALGERANIEDLPYTPAAYAFVEAGDDVRGFRYWIEVGKGVKAYRRSKGEGAQPHDFAVAEREARRIVRRVGVAEVFRFSEAYEFVRDQRRGFDGWDYGTDPPTDVFRVVTQYAEVLVVRDIMDGAYAEDEARLPA